MSSSLIYYTYSVVHSTGDNMLCMKMIKKAVDKARAKKLKAQQQQQQQKK